MTTTTRAMLSAHFKAPVLKRPTSDRSGEKSATKPPNYGIRPDLTRPTVKTWPPAKK